MNFNLLTSLKWTWNSFPSPPGPLPQDLAMSVIPLTPSYPYLLSLPPLESKFISSHTHIFPAVLSVYSFNLFKPLCKDKSL